MYQNRIRRTASNLDLQSLISRSDIVFDKRARYVEFVCNVWNEGRFGPDLAEPVVLDLGGRPEPEPALFTDLLDYDPNVPAVSYALLFLGRATYQQAEAAYRSAKQMEIIHTAPIVSGSLAFSAPNQGRGSP